MQRRDFFKGLLAAPVMSAAAADECTDRTKGLPPLTIKDVKVISTSGGRNYRWVFLKVITSEPGLYGIGSANDSYQHHVDISSSAFGIQEENHFPAQVHEMLPGTAEIRKGYMYGSGRPGLGIDINEEMAAKYPIAEARNGGAYGTGRALDGAVTAP
jgi:L-alanine-DL-glutamate epimerase-like enolase superfamily enzyme